MCQGCRSENYYSEKSEITHKGHEEKKTMLQAVLSAGIPESKDEEFSYEIPGEALCQYMVCGFNIEVDVMGGRRMRHKGRLNLLCIAYALELNFTAFILFSFPLFPFLDS